MIEKQFELKTEDGIIRGSYSFKETGKFPVLFFLHGFTGEMNGTRYLLRSFHRLLNENEIGTVKFDYIGCGNSTGDFTSNNITSSIRQTQAVINYFKDNKDISKMYIAGYSMGGMIAVEVVKQMQNRFAKILLWSPAFNMSDILRDAYSKCPRIDSHTVDYFGIKLTDEVVKDSGNYNSYNFIDDDIEVLIISGEIDEAVPYEIAQKGYNSFRARKNIYKINRANHSYDGLDLRNELYQKSLKFLK